MILFKRFERNTAIFEIDGKSVELTKKKVLKLHNTSKQSCGRKGTCPDTEQTKFVLDRWPGTELAKRIEKQKRPD
jgi:hypothetical protein